MAAERIKKGDINLCGSNDERRFVEKSTKTITCNRRFSKSLAWGSPPHKKMAKRYLTKAALRRVTEVEEITWQAFMESDFSRQPKL